LPSNATEPLSLPDPAKPVQGPTYYDGTPMEEPVSSSWGSIDLGRGASASSLGSVDLEPVTPTTKRALHKQSACPDTPPAGPMCGMGGTGGTNLQRSYSAQSMRTIDRIGEIGGSIGELESKYEVIMRDFEGEKITQGKAKDSLGQLYGTLFKVP